MVAGSRDGVLRFGGIVTEDQEPTLPAEEPTTASGMIQKFFQWVATVWLEQHPRMSAEEIAALDPSSLMPEYHAYIDRGGYVDTEHGLTLEQTWLLAQLTTHTLYVCVINSLQRPTPSARITRKYFMTGQEIIELLREIFIKKVRTKTRIKLDKQEPIPATVYDGDRVTHAITLFGQDRATGSFVYHDPWPDRSLLCAENNSAGVAAVPVPSGERLWMITPEEFEAVVFSILVPTNIWEQKRKGL